ncbi:hypothetical protein QYF36_024326 [Acer negundo]|nr:hypothetical protein QYF36_024326 [Acer negundo]
MEIRVLLTAEELQALTTRKTYFPAKTRVTLKARGWKGGIVPFIILLLDTIDGGKHEVCKPLELVFHLINSGMPAEEVRLEEQKFVEMKLFNSVKCLGISPLANQTGMWPLRPQFLPSPITIKLSNPFTFVGISSPIKFFVSKRSVIFLN